jgi:hypothetical protein
MKTPTSERGIALPTVLVALMALSALALAMTTTSRNEVVVAGVQTRTVHTLQVADGALNYALGIPANFADPSSKPAVNLRTAGLPFDGSVQVDYIPPRRLPPPGVRVSALKVRSYLFRLTSEGLVNASTTSLPSSSTQLEMEASKLGPAG